MDVLPACIWPLTIHLHVKSMKWQTPGFDFWRSLKLTFTWCQWIPSLFN